LTWLAFVQWRNPIVVWVRVALFCMLGLMLGSLYWRNGECDLLVRSNLNFLTHSVIAFRIVPCMRRCSLFWPASQHRARLSLWNCRDCSAVLNAHCALFGTGVSNIYAAFCAGKMDSIPAAACDYAKQYEGVTDWFVSLTSLTLVFACFRALRWSRFWARS
jgi:hypothetical protein